MKIREIMHQNSGKRHAEFFSRVKHVRQGGSGTFQRSILLFTTFFSMCLGCQHSSQSHNLLEPTSKTPQCARIEAKIDLQDRIETLQAIAKAYDKKCFQTVVTYGPMAQTEYRHKTFSLSKELGNLFLPDGTTIDYVMESYERGFLSQLLALSHFHLENPEASKVELRRLDHEIFTPLYNYGADPVNLLFSAVLWEMLGQQNNAWIDWSRLENQKGLDDAIRRYSSSRKNMINANDNTAHEWTIYAVGSFPSPEWDVQFNNFNGGYYSVKPRQQFLPSCSSKSGVRISTESWFEKISVRHTHAYHPLLNIQSWLRLPVGLVYSVSTFAAGASVVVGGCVADGIIRGGGGLCRIFAAGGMGLMEQSPKVLRKMLRPDLRHWENVPSSFLFTTARDITEEPCFPGGTDQGNVKFTQFFREY